LQKLVIPLKQKENKKVSHHAHESLFEQKKRGKDDKSKSIDDGQVSLFTHAHDKST